MHALRKMSACFTDVTSITTCTGRFIHSARTELIREKIFHVKQVLDFEGRKNKLDVNRFTKSNDKFAHSTLCYTREPPNVRYLEIELWRFLLIDTA